MQRQIIRKNYIYLTAFAALISVFIFSALSIPVFASQTDGTITTGGDVGFAWSNNIGWVNFGITNGNVHITDTGMTGNVWSSTHGWINLAPSNGGVTVAASGALSGYAWGSGLGWINFSGVSINSSGKFVGQAIGSVIGTLTFDCDNCNVTTDYRPQNFRVVTTPPPSSGGGGGGGGGIPFVSGPGGQAVPAHIDAYNVPMKLFPAQSGTLTQNLTNQKRVILDTPSNIYSDDITFIIREETVSPTISTKVSIIGNALFNITAWDKANNPVRSFLKPIKITLNVPELLRGRSDLGVYFFDDAANLWVKIPDAVFSGDAVSFYINHLTLFAIFAGPELSLTIEAPFQLPPQFQFEIQRGGVETPREGVEVPAGKVPSTEITSEEKPPLFDIEVGPGPAASKNNRAYYIVAIIAIVIAGAVIYILQKRKKRRQIDEI